MFLFLDSSLPPKNCKLNQTLDFSRSLRELVSRSDSEIRLESKSLTAAYYEKRIRNFTDDRFLFINLINI